MSNSIIGYDENNEPIWHDTPEPLFEVGDRVQGTEYKDFRGRKTRVSGYIVGRSFNRVDRRWDYLVRSPSRHGALRTWHFEESQLIHVPSVVDQTVAALLKEAGLRGGMGELRSRVDSWDCGRCDNQGGECKAPAGDACWLTDAEVVVG